MSNLYEPTFDRIIGDIQFICAKDQPWREIIHLVPEQSRILEIGAGTGKLGLMFAYWRQCDVTLLDVDMNACLYQLRLLRILEGMLGARLPVIVRNGDVLKENAKPRFDMVMSEGVIEHYTDVRRQEIVKRHYEYTHDYAVLITTNGDSPIAVAKATSRKEPFDQAVAYERPFRKLELLATLEEAGFENIHVDTRRLYLKAEARR